MNKLFLTLLTLSSTFFNFNLQGNECNQPNTFYVQENNFDTSPSFDCASVYPCTDIGFYVGGFAGVGILESSGNAGFTGGLSGGYKFENNFRLEGEFAYRYHKQYASPMKTYTLMANTLYDFSLIRSFTPYIGFGFGYGRVSASYRSFLMGYQRVHINHFVMQGILGLSRKVWKELHLGLEYRIFGTEDDIYDHSIVVSVKRFM